MGGRGNILILGCLDVPLICEGVAFKELTPALTATTSQITIPGAAMNKRTCGKGCADPF